jgi:aryl-alcohol dehydrogenase-like predicted oxidoreductase
LGTDFVDVYWLHAWDTLTPVDEVVRALDDVVRAGKVRYLGFSNVPAWYAARAFTMAEHLGREKICALQLEYSLVERSIEREHVPFAVDVGLGVVPWGALASGLLTGKQSRTSTTGRIKAFAGSTHPGFAKLFLERNWPIVDAVNAAAREIGKSSAQVALSWAAKRPGVVSTIVGATSVKLDEVSALDVTGPYAHFHPSVRGEITGGTSVTSEPPWYRLRS